MTIPRSYLVIFLVALALSSQAQDDSTRGVSITNRKTDTAKGKSYALIIGISEYQNFPSLNYADNDAFAFYDFLRSPAVGLDSANIFMCINEKAKGGDIWRAVRWLLRNADTTGETAFIYFAGHGDAASAAEAYLLGHDAPNEGDPILYNGNGTCDIYNLKERIKEMTRKGVKVVLITDACRTNELPGKENGAAWTFTGITESRSGEIQMTSCAGNEQSMEDIRWGNGRGVFSYHLVNGLSGLADNDPQNNEITLYELEKYVRSNVRNDTWSLTTNKPRQNPVFCCTEFNDQPLFKVNTAYKEKIAKTISSGNTSNTTIATRSGLHLADSVQRVLYEHFLESIRKKYFILPEDSSAVHYADRLLELVKDNNSRIDIQDHIVAELMNAAQAIINRYTNPPREDTTSQENAIFFSEGAQYLAAALKYLDGNPELKQEVTAKKLFLQATAIAEDQYDYDRYYKVYEGIAKADSSLRISTTSYAHNTLGLLYKWLYNNDTAKQHFIAAGKLAPRWTYPLMNLANLYRDANQTDSALFYYKRCIALNPNFKNAYYNLGVLFYQVNRFDSALHYFRNATGLNASYTNAYNYLGITFLGLKQYDSARIYLRKVIELDSLYETGYYNLGVVYIDTDQLDSAIYYSKKAATLYTAYNNAYHNIGIAYYRKGLYDSAYAYYKKAIFYNPSQYLSFFSLGILFEDKYQYDSAIYYYNKAIKANPSYCDAYTNKGLIFYDREDYDVALFCFGKTLACDPQDEYAHNGIGMVHLMQANYDSARSYFSAALTYNPEMAHANYNMGRYYYYRYYRSDDSALLYLGKAASLKLRSADLYYLMGDIYQTLGRTDSALACLHSSLAINPAYTLTLTSLGKLHERTRNYDSALHYYQLVYEFKQTAATTYSMASVYGKMKDTENVLKYLEITFKLDDWYAYSASAETAFQYLKNDERFRKLVARYGGY